MKAIVSLATLVGTYTGSWTFFRRAEDGSAVATYSMTDTATASNPQQVGDRVFVVVRDVMRMPDREMTLEFHEGFLMKADGSAGERFIEMFGQQMIERPVGDRAWAYQTPVSAQELDQLGLHGASAAVHTTVKVELVIGGIETQHVTRLTTAQLPLPDGSHTTAQFVSMTGVHTRPAPH